MDRSTDWDPSVVAANLANEAVLVRLLTYVSNPAPIRSGFPALSHLRTHPDLVDRMAEGAAALPAQRVSIGGYTALAHPNGVLFTVAVGMKGIYLRLPAGTPDLVPADDADAMFGDGWTKVDPWPLRLSEPWISIKENMARARADALIRFQQWNRLAYDRAAQDTPSAVAPALPPIAHLECMMSITRDAVSAWLDAYIRAWDSYDPARIGALFSEDATYAYHPWDARPMRGREAIVAGWLSDRDAPGSWSARYEPVAIDGDTVVATGRSHYRETADHPAREYFNCFIMRFDEDGRCTDFMECYMLHPKPTAG